MSDTSTSYIPAPAGDFVLPFDLPQIDMRGRLVRLDQTSAQALANHLLPEAAARVAGEAMALVALLASTLKLDGRLTLQTKSDGPLDLVSADYYGGDEQRGAGLRSFARLDQAKFDALQQAQPDFARLTGSGALGITIEPRLDGQTYQGIVELSEQGLAASAETYFAQSEQLPTMLRLAAAPVFTPGNPVPQWRAGGLLLQATPGAGRDDDTWERLSLFLKTVEDIELVDTLLPGEDLLWRLFHEDEVRVLPAEHLSFRCDCDADRIRTVLQSYAPDERADLADPDGIIRARCEFCGTVHQITLT